MSKRWELILKEYTDIQNEGSSSEERRNRPLICLADACQRIAEFEISEQGRGGLMCERCFYNAKSGRCFDGEIVDLNADLINIRTRLDTLRTESNRNLQMATDMANRLNGEMEENKTLHAENERLRKGEE